MKKKRSSNKWLTFLFFSSQISTWQVMDGVGKSTRSKAVYGRTTERSGLGIIKGYSKKKNRGIRLGLKTEGMEKSIYNEQLDQQVILLTQSKAISPEVYFLVRLKQRTRRILDWGTQLRAAVRSHSEGRGLNWQMRISVLSS